MSQVLFGGATRTVRVECEDRLTTLFHGAVGASAARAHYGIGFSTACGKRRFWGTVVPRPVVQSWRAYQLLQELPWIDSTVLAACMYVVKRNLDLAGEGRHYMEKVAFCKGIPVGHLVPKRQMLLSLAPDQDELDFILAHLHMAEIEVDTGELEEELALGLVHPSPYLDLVMSARASMA